MFEWNIYLLIWIDIFVKWSSQSSMQMKSEFQQAMNCLEQISKEKWTWAYDGGKRYGHMTTNLAEWMNSVLEGTCVLPITTLVKTTFKRIKSWFVERGIHASCILQTRHDYPEKVAIMLQENCHCARMHHVQRYTRETWV